MHQLRAEYCGKRHIPEIAAVVFPEFDYAALFALIFHRFFQMFEEEGDAAGERNRRQNFPRTKVVFDLGKDPGVGDGGPGDHYAVAPGPIKHPACIFG